MKATVEDIQKALNRIEESEKIKSKLVANTILKRIESIDNFLGETLNKGAFPKIWGKPTRFSLWIRRIKLEIYKTNDPLAEKIVVKQRGKVIGETLIKTKISSNALESDK